MRRGGEAWVGKVVGIASAGICQIRKPLREKILDIPGIRDTIIIVSNTYAGKDFPSFAFPAVCSFNLQGGRKNTKGDIMKERRDSWKDLKPTVELAIKDAFEKYIPIIVEQCKAHDEVIILKHELRSSNKKNFVVWGLAVGVFNAVLSAILWKWNNI